ncbi:MAG: hypothetical protein KDK23_07855 [Leptospiraceae bacterium]|nr:hypothetical protein [Leptospiraceae bacterium]
MIITNTREKNKYRPLLQCNNSPGVPWNRVALILFPLLVFSASCLSFCRSAEVKPDEELPPGLKAKKEKILENYQPGNCFLAGFNIALRNSQGSQSAVGEVRSDPKNRRLHLEFRVPYIGITLSQLTILNGQAFVKNVQMDRMETIPVENLMVQGMGQNSIRLPFIFFQELLFAGLPANVVERGKWTESPDGTVSASVKNPSLTVDYRFARGYLEQIIYENTETAETIRVDLTGLRSRNPAIPSRLTIVARKAGGPAESMIIDFGSVNPSASCEQYRFPTSF